MNRQKKVWAWMGIQFCNLRDELMRNILEGEANLAWEEAK